MKNQNSLDLEKEYYSDDISLIAGCDEAGRGPLAGPLVVAACLFPNNYFNAEINDSKKLTPKKREELYNIIIKDSLAYSIIIIEPEEIDKLNIYEASRTGMYRAISKLDIKPHYVLTDAMPLPLLKIPHSPIIKGDAKSINIAGASILAKVTRDKIMEEIDKKYPQYQFNKHKGYPTKLHLDLLKQYGPVKGLYRYSYKPVKDTLIDFEPLF